MGLCPAAPGLRNRIIGTFQPYRSTQAGNRVDDETDSFHKKRWSGGLFYLGYPANCFPDQLIRVLIVNKLAGVERIIGRHIEITVS